MGVGGGVRGGGVRVRGGRVRGRESDAFDDGSRLRRRAVVAPRAAFRATSKSTGTSSRNRRSKSTTTRVICCRLRSARSVMPSPIVIQSGADALTAAPRFTCDDRALSRSRGVRTRLITGRWMRPRGRVSLGMPDFLVSETRGGHVRRRRDGGREGQSTTTGCSCRTAWITTTRESS